MARRRPPGTPAGLDAGQVVAAALDVLRRDGVEGVSMRAVALQLRVAPNALYGHVAGKDALLDAVTGRLVDGVPTDDDAGWRFQLHCLAHHVWNALRPYPALAARFLTSPAASDAAQGVRAHADAALAGARVPAERRDPLVTALVTLAAGLACAGERADQAALDAGLAGLLDSVARSAH